MRLESREARREGRVENGASHYALRSTLRCLTHDAKHAAASPGVPSTMRRDPLRRSRGPLMHTRRPLAMRRRPLTVTAAPLAVAWGSPLATRLSPLDARVHTPRTPGPRTNRSVSSHDNVFRRRGIRSARFDWRLRPRENRVRCHGNAVRRHGNGFRGDRHAFGQPRAGESRAITGQSIARWDVRVAVRRRSLSVARAALTTTAVPVA